MESNALQIFSTLMQWIVAPVAAFVWFIYMQQQKHATAIAVLQAESVTAKAAHERDIREIKETTKAIFVKLDSIEEGLRK